MLGDMLGEQLVGHVISVGQELGDVHEVLHGDGVLAVGVDPARKLVGA